MPPDVGDIANLAARVRAHLEAEQELGSPGLRLTSPPPAPARDTSRRQRTPARAVEHAQDAVSAPSPQPPLVESGGGAGEEAVRQLTVLAEQASVCTACRLHEGRHKSVFARGRHTADLAFVGEGPGRDEDRRGLPFVGKAGQLLDRMIAAMGYARDDVYICNVVKCRPPDNRTPLPDEAAACERFLIGQLEIVRPRVIVALGRCAAQNLGVAQPTGPWRGRWRTWREVPVMPTYHPAFLLRSPQFKRQVWEDLQKVMTRLGKPISTPD